MKRITGVILCLKSNAATIANANPCFCMLIIQLIQQKPDV